MLRSDFTYKVDELIVHEVPTKINSKRYQTSQMYVAGSLKVFLNGMKEQKTDVNIITSTLFEFYDDTEVEDIIEVEYVRNTI